MRALDLPRRVVQVQMGLLDWVTDTDQADRDQSRTAKSAANDARLPKPVTPFGNPNRRKADRGLFGAVSDE